MLFNTIPGSVCIFFDRLSRRLFTMLPVINALRNPSWDSPAKRIYLVERESMQMRRSELGTYLMKLREYKERRK